MHIATTRTFNPRTKSTPYTQAWGTPHRNKIHLQWGCLLVLTSPKELQKGETGREEYGAFLGVDHTSIGGVMAVNLNTCKIIHRRSYRAFLNKYRWPKQSPDAQDKFTALLRVVSGVVGDDGDDDDAREGGESDDSSDDDDVVDMVSDSDNDDDEQNNEIHRRRTRQ